MAQEPLDPSNPWPTWNPDFPYLLLDPSGDDELLVREARDLIFAGCIDGTRCPCCTQFVKLYGRPLTGSLGYCLKWLVRAVSGLPVETGSARSSGGHVHGRGRGVGRCS